MMEMLDTINISSETLLNTLNDILDFSKNESGNLKLESNSFSIKHLINECYQLFESSAVGRNNSLDVSIADDLPSHFIGDKHRIKQVLTNYLTNAIKFTNNGKIKIGAELLSTTSDHCFLSLWVSDTGIGIAEKYHPELYSAFIQADASTTRVYGGSGLGLSICAQLAELMGGEIFFESKENEGSKFYLKIHLKKSQAIEINNGMDYPSRLEVVKNQQSRHFLIVEDNLINQKVMALILRRLDFTCDIACNGQEAIDRITVVGPGYYSIIFMDMQMPVMDGIEATKRIKQKYGFDSPSIIAVTANAYGSDKECCLAAGMCDFLSKPVKKSTLQEIIQRYAI